MKVGSLGIASSWYGTKVAALGRLLIGLGLVLIGCGALIWLLSKKEVALPRLPLDIVVERPGLKIYIPLGTSLLISLILTLLFYIVSRFRSGQ
ncbi:MAG: DUF2905 family protein [Bacteroidia bacterium]|nr:DUF2905 family protein [Bacteroidia bacterium]